MEEDSISPVVGVLLMVVIVILIAALAMATFLDFGQIDESTSSSSSGFELEEHKDHLSVTSIKGDSKADILVDGTKVSSVSGSGDTETIPYHELFDTTKTGETKTVSVVSDGNVIKSRTVELKSSYDPYKDPSTLEKNDVNLVSKTSPYDGNEDRLLKTTEIYVLKFKDRYDPSDFDYTWRQGECNSDCSERWDYKIVSSDKNESTYKYTSTGYGYSFDQTASVAVNISDPNSDTSYLIETVEFDVGRPIQSVSFKGNLSGTNRKVGETEKWNVTSISNHPQVDDYLSDPPQKLSEYNYSSWSRYCTGLCLDSWDADITQGMNGKEYAAYYEYTDSGSGYQRSAAPSISISIDGLEAKKSYNPEAYEVD